MNRSEPAARPYAEAVLHLAEERGKAGAVLDELRAVMAMLHADRKLWGFFVSPRVDRAHKAEIVKRAFRGQVGEEVLGLLVVLIRKGREPLLDNVVGYFDRMWDVMEKRVHVHIRSARPADARIRSEVEQAIREATGKTPVTHEEVDPSLLGGLVVRVNDLVVDGSLRTRLRSLRGRLLGERR